LALGVKTGWAQPAKSVNTVTGPIPAAELGVTLMHEHIITDLRAPAERKPGDYNAEEAFQVALPKLRELKQAGCASLVEITPLHIGRDAATLARLARESGLNIVCATGIYGAANQRFIPDYAHSASADDLAAKYISEIQSGIEATGIRPGIIKTGVNRETPLPDIEKKLVRAAALAGKATGLAVASHTGPGAPALEEIEIVKSAGLDPARFIWVHAQSEKDHALHRKAAEAGAWVEFDGIGPQSVDWHVECVRAMADAGLLHRTLVSQDAGWYRPGPDGGSKYRGYTLLFDEFLPRLRKSGFGDLIPRSELRGAEWLVFVNG
jgi:phosphotriesterase-related protein